MASALADRPKEPDELPEVEPRKETDCPIVLERVPTQVIVPSSVIVDSVDEEAVTLREKLGLPVPEASRAVPET